MSEKVCPRCYGAGNQIEEISSFGSNELPDLTFVDCGGCGGTGWVPMSFGARRRAKALPNGKTAFDEAIKMVEQLALNTGGRQTWETKNRKRNIKVK